jgi:HD superfamily phosphohydrolase
MYWQVYLHKTVLSAENLLVNILTRAKDLAERKTELFCTPQLRTFLYNKYSKSDFISDPKLLDTFARLDDYDIMTSVKVWCDHQDTVLSMLCRQLVNRELFKVELQKVPFKEDKTGPIRKDIKKRFKLSDKETEYFVLTGTIANDAYRADRIRINILAKDGSISDITEASDQLNIDVLAKTVKKYYLCYPK